MWTSSAEVSRARIYQRQMQTQQESKEKRAGSGTKWRGSSVKSAPNMSLLKTRQDLFRLASKKSYGIFPKSGIMHNGNVYKLDSLDFPTREKESLSLPTPIKSDNSTLQWSAAEQLLSGEGTRPSGSTIQKSLNRAVAMNLLKKRRKRFTGCLNPNFLEWMMG